MSEIVFGIAGQIGSGKSTIAKSLAQALHCEAASFGSYVRSVAKRDGWGDDRRTLQDLGQDLLENKGAEDFCIEMLQQQARNFTPGTALVIDGVRHLTVADALTHLVKPSRFALVYMRVDEHIRLQRLETREAGLPNLVKSDAHKTEHDVRKRLQNLVKLDAHKTEHDVRKRLRGRADIILVAARPSGELVRVVRDWRASELLLGSGRSGMRTT